MNKKIKKKIFTLISAVMISILTACSTTVPVPDSVAVLEGGETKSVEDLKIVTILISSGASTTTSMGNAIKEHAESLGAECTLQYYEQNVSIQMNMIENAIMSGADVLIMQNQSAGDCADEINRAVESGMTVVLYGDASDDISYTYRFTEDSTALGRQMGKMAADWANKKLTVKGEPVVAAVGNYSVTPIAANRNKGIVEALEEFCPDIVIADTYEMAYKEEGIEVGENILQAHPDVNLVVGINDGSVCGVYEAFLAAGKTEDIGMFGIDGTAEAEYLISQNTMMKGILDIDPNEVGKQMVEYGIARATGDASAPEPGIVYWKGKEVTQDNINDFEEKWGSFSK